jgi:hypothetical protein
MKPTNRKEISEALKEAMNKEDLHTRDAAKYLNINPCYISMAQNPNSWDSMGKASWIRLEEWFNTNSKIALFEIPPGEEIWVPREKPIKQDNADAVIKTVEKVPKFKDKPSKLSKKDDEPAKFNYDFLKGKNLQIDEEEGLLKIKEAISAFKSATEPWIEISKGVGELAKHYKARVQNPTETRQLIAIDIEINLVVNGQKVHL